jgi:cytochrome b6-f complex iron-sulfur subunit
MEIDRRQFVLLSAAAAAAVATSGCQSGGGSGGSSKAPVNEGVVIAGPERDYAADGVYDRYRDRGFFLVRSEGKLVALSSICTHRTCLLRANPDHSFHCPCHGSRFDSQGKVTKGPAARDLPVLPIVISSGQVVVENVKAP